MLHNTSNSSIPRSEREQNWLSINNYCFKAIAFPLFLVLIYQQTPFLVSRVRNKDPPPPPPPSTHPPPQKKKNNERERGKSTTKR